MAKLTIKNRQGKTVEVTDLQKAIDQAEFYCSMHEKAKKHKDVIYYKDAHLDWEHDLKELKKLKEKA